MIESIQFYTALFIVASPAILTFAIIALVIMSIPVYLYETRYGLEVSNDKEIE